MSRNPDNDQPRRQRAANWGDRDADVQADGTSDQPLDESAEGGQPATPPTFGSFVSSSVRRSAGRQRGQSGQGGQSGAQPGEAASTRPRRLTGRDASRDASRSDSRRATEGDASVGRTDGTRPSGRRSFVPTDDAPEPRRRPPAAPATSLPPAMQDVVDRVGGTRQALGLVAGAIVLLILLIVLLINLIGGNDDGGADPTPTATATEEDSILVPPGSGSPEATGTTAVPPPTTDTGAGPDRDALVTPTSGSDNQLNEQPAQGTPPVTGRARFPVVRCPDGCMMRMANGEGTEAMLRDNGTRPSFSGDAWLWAVADPDGATAISSQVPVEVVRQGTDTLRLYMVTVPNGVAEQGASDQFGAVLDRVDAHRLVEVDGVPARVRVVVQTGLIVEKVAPAPPSSFSRPADRPAIDAAGIDSLLDTVVEGNLQAIIADLQGAGSTDGSGIGSRYYTAPGNQISADYLFTLLESFGLSVWYEEFVTPDSYLLVNVVGEIAGTDSSRLYGVMAHFDSTSDLPTTVAPGADDNATGAAAVLEISRVLSAHELRYTYRAIFVNSEETGILGAQAFAEDAIAAGDPWEGIFNLDSVGSARNGQQLVLNATGESVWMEDILARVNDGYGIGLPLVPYQDPEIVADDNRLRDRGIESVLVARELYGWSPIHHTTDDIASRVSIPHVERVTTLVLLTIASLLQ